MKFLQLVRECKTNAGCIPGITDASTFYVIARNETLEY